MIQIGTLYPILLRIKGCTTRVTQGQPRRESLMFPLAVCPVLAHPLGFWGVEEEAFLVAFTFTFALAFSFASAFTVAALTSLTFPSAITLRRSIGLTFTFRSRFHLRFRFGVND